MKKFIFFMGCCFLIGAFFAVRSKRQPAKMNVLFVSACSLRSDRLGIYNSASHHSPQIDEWTHSASVVFDNAVSERPWQAFMSEADDVITPEFLRASGYDEFRRSRGNHFMIPPMSKKSSDEWYWTEDAILHYSDAAGELKAALTGPHEKPFFALVLLKYMHYPYLDSVNMGAADWATLSPKSQELLSRYRRRPMEYEAQLPLVELILNSYNLVKNIFGVKSEVLSAAGVISDPTRAEIWHKTASFPDDLALAKELYDLKMRKFDAMAAEILNLYDDTSLKNNTVVIFSGDHGEAFMEHGVLGHSVNLYEEMLRYPLVVKFPGHSPPVRLQQQTTHRLTALLLKRLLQGEFANAEQFSAAATSSSPEYILSRNCSNTMQSVRSQGKWKFIKNMDSGRNELYDLNKDPEERFNLVEQKAEVAFKLEEQLLTHLEDLSHANGRAQRAKLCQ